MLTLLLPVATAFEIHFDYRHDGGYFSDHPERRAILEAAARIWSELLADAYPAVPGRLLPPARVRSDGRAYRGDVSTTLSGRSCQRWTAQAPHRHDRTPERYLGTGLGDHAHCRNPDHEATAWCYTTDPAVRWEYCDTGDNLVPLGSVGPDADDLLIFVYATDLDVEVRARPLFDLGLATGAERELLKARRAAGHPWLGEITFDTTRPWFFDPTPESADDLPGSTHDDFLTSAVQGIGQVLGLSTANPPFRGLRHVPGRREIAMLGALGWTVAAPTPGRPPVSSEEASVCRRWRSTFVPYRPASDWHDGEVARCEAGRVGEEARRQTLARVGLYRELAGLPPLTEDSASSEDAQACALMMHVGDRLSHTPGPGWPCHTEAGARFAGRAVLASGTVQRSVDLYIADANNEDTLGHRRWLLSSWGDRLALGGTDQASCMAITGEPAPDPGPILWPPGGVVPVDLEAQVHTTGWSLQGEGLENARFRLLRDGEVLPVQTRALRPGYGSWTAWSLVPAGWTVSPGDVIRVEVEGLAAPFARELRFVDCER